MSESQLLTLTAAIIYAGRLAGHIALEESAFANSIRDAKDFVLELKYGLSKKE